MLNEFGSGSPDHTNTPAIGDPNDREVADEAKELGAKIKHLYDIYEALGVQWNGDPFTRIKYLRESAADVETKEAFIENLLAELGLAGVTDEMTIARRIRGLIKQAETGKPAPQLYDSMPLFGYELITRERIRQITQEGFSEAHDDEHTDHSLAIVAAIYAVADVDGITVRGTIEPTEEMHVRFVDAWPKSWNEKWRYKIAEHPRLRQLAIAGALIGAEIDRLQRTADSYERQERETIATELEIDRRNDL